MNILLAITSLSSGGAERIAVHLMERWLLDGHRVHLVTLGGPDSDFYSISDNISRDSLNCAGRQKTRFSFLSENLFRFREMRKAIVKAEPDVVISLMTYCNILCLGATVGMQVPVLVAEHNYPPFSTRSRVWKSVRRFAYGRASTVLALNTTCAQWLEQNTRAPRVIVIPNPVKWPVPNVTPTVDTDLLAPNVNLFLSVGRLNEQKAFHRLIAAFAQISHALPNWQLAIAGEGELHAALSAEIDRLELSSSVKLLGRVGNISDWHNRADVFVLSSNYEGFPGALLEAMASGTPVVAVDCLTGPRDFIQPHETGLLCEMDEDALAKTMLQMANDTALRAKVGPAGQYVSDKYSEEAVHALWNQEFNRLGLLP